MLKRLVISAGVLVLIMIIAAAALFIAYDASLKPVDEAAVDELRLVEIPPGAGAETIAALLYESGLIKNELAFRLYLRFNNIEQNLLAGRYRFSAAMSAGEIAEKMVAGDVYAETTWFTIPEGFTVTEMAARLERLGLVEAERFLELVDSPSDKIIAAHPYLAEINDPAVSYLLEGYLFPDTYEVYTDAGAEEIILLMLRRMDQVFDPELTQRLMEKDLTRHRVLTIAAMVEREVRVDHERALVAGIIYNRLAIGQRLEIDATIQYALGETREFLLYADLEIDSPYNTYRNDGLPPGPIAAPGEASIRAALYPKESDYYFYNYKYDNSGEHFFSHTYEEHLQNVKKAEANLQ